MNKIQELYVPLWFTMDGLQVLQTITSPKTVSIGLLLVGVYFNEPYQANPLVRVYLLQYSDGAFEMTKELEAYSFESIEEAYEFVNRLPRLSVVDLIMILSRQEIVLN
ncbi:MAG: hypothetical protein RR651_07070 [Lysinibacillus sp.]